MNRVTRGFSTISVSALCILIAMGFGAGCAGVAPEEAVGPAHAGDRIEMEPERLHAMYEELFNEGDLDGLLDLYEDDVAIMGEGEVLRGKDSLREELKGFLALEGRIEVTTRYVVQSGDVALMSAEWHVVGGSEGEPLDMRGKSAEVVRRQADGRWLYVCDHATGGG
jgi:uncharacterized protein (TIGR02246 family)